MIYKIIILNSLTKGTMKKYILYLSFCSLIFINIVNTLEQDFFKNILQNKKSLKHKNLISKNQKNETVESILEKLEQEDTQFVSFTFVNLFGDLKEIIVPFDKAKNAFINGLTFDSSSIPGYFSTEESDMILKPDLSTLRFLPWTSDLHKTAWVICDIYKDRNTLYESDSRYILKKAIKELNLINCKCNIGVELEFFLYKNSEPLDNKKYIDPDEIYSRQQENHIIIHTLKSMGVDVEKLHHEVAPGQYEFSIKYDNALEIADQVIIAKYALKVLANQLGYEVIFLPKPIYGKNGSAMHIHYSIYDNLENKNAFYSYDNDYNFSDLGKKFLAGNLSYIKEFSAILNPLINSYKRLVPDFEAPVYICWGLKNRSALFRLPLMHDEPDKAMRIEIRSPDANCNPYLAFSAIIKTGLKGIKEDLILNKPITQNLFKLDVSKIRDMNIKVLPKSLSQALDVMQDSQMVKDLLTPKGFEEYIKVKRQDCANFNSAVTNWELN